MRIHIVIEVDDDLANPRCATGLTARGYEQLADAITSTVGELISVSGASALPEGKRVG